MVLENLIAKVKLAVEEGESLRIVGGDSKAFYGRDLSDVKPISTLGLNKIVSYEPSELVVQVEAGCSIEELTKALDAENQMLGFEPSDFGGATIGGAIATGLSGSRRPYSGAGRDFLLGVNVLDGSGNHLQFGGQVMKNVAGYDVSRLMAGAMGCLGLITEVSLKVLPKPEVERSMSKPVAKDELLTCFSSLAKRPETSALAYWEGRLFVRFSGSESSVQQCIKRFDGEAVEPEFWKNLDSLAMFSTAKTLWRVSSSALSQADGFAEADLIDWGGGQRWFVNQEDPPVLDNGYATLLKSEDLERERFAPLAPYVMQVHRNLKQTFDPYNVFNPGKMYADF